MTWLPSPSRLALLVPSFLGLSSLGLLSGGCATNRVTDPPRTATEQFLLSTAASRAVAQLSIQGLRDRKLWLDFTYFNAPESAFVVGELRAKLLLNGARLLADRADADIILEVRSGGVGVDRREYLLGLPALTLPSATGGVAAETPELAIVKNTRQRGFASVAFVAYWAKTGEVVFASGPFTGRSLRDDWWLFGTGPRTRGNIAPTENVSPGATGGTAAPAGGASTGGSPPGGGGGTSAGPPAGGGSGAGTSP